MSVNNLAELRKQSKLPAKQAGIGTVKAFFESQKPAIAAVLPRHMSPERIAKIALGAVRGNPQLLECTVESLFGAVIKCAELGLEPNTPLGHVYLIPFNTRKGDKWVKEVQVIPGYKGLIDLARRSGQIISIAAHEVCENDEFSFSYGLDEHLTHRPLLRDRGQVIAYYAIAKLGGGGYAFEVMSIEQIEEIRDNSKGYQAAVASAKKYKKDIDSPWVEHPVEMGRKTAVRRICKYLPMSIEIAAPMGQALALDNAVHDGQSQHLEAVLEGEWVLNDSEPEQPEEQSQESVDTTENDTAIK